MKAMITGRQLGKSRKILEWMAESPPGVNHICLCFSYGEAARMYKEACILGLHLSVERFVSIADIANNSIYTPSGHVTVVGIDNLEILLGDPRGIPYLPYPVEFITMTALAV